MFEKGLRYIPGHPQAQRRECCVSKREYLRRAGENHPSWQLEGMAEYYSAELPVKVKRGQKESALKCKANGGMIPFGYKISADRFYEIDPLTALMVCP